MRRTRRVDADALAGEATIARVFACESLLGGEVAASTAWLQVGSARSTARTGLASAVVSFSGNAISS